MAPLLLSPAFIGLRQFCANLCHGFGWVRNLTLALKAFIYKQESPQVLLYSAESATVNQTLASSIHLFPVFRPISFPNVNLYNCYA